MFNSGMASERDVLQAEQEAVNARAEQKRIDEVYAIYHITGNSTYEIQSPVSGFVIGKNVSRNMQIRSDQTEELFTISGLDNVWVMADVYESDISVEHIPCSFQIAVGKYNLLPRLLALLLVISHFAAMDNGEYISFLYIVAHLDIHLRDISLSISVPVFNRNQGNIKSARLAVLQNTNREQYNSFSFYFSYPYIQYSLVINS